MRVFRRGRLAWLVVTLLVLTSALTLIQVETSTTSYAQFITQTSYPTGISPTWHMHTGNRTWTNVGNRTFTWPGNMTWGHVGNRTWGSHTINQTWTGIGNQTRSRTYTSNWTLTQPANLTGRKRGGIPGLGSGWAHSNVTVAARNLTQPIFMNGTEGVRLGFIAINASSSGQFIRNVAYNESIAQIEFDGNGSIQVTVNSSAKPSMVFADGNLLSQAPSLVGLTPQSDAWFYDPNNQALTIFADPTSITLVYTPTATGVTTQVPEYPVTPYFALIGSLVITISLAAGKSKTRARKASQHS